MRMRPAPLTDDSPDGHALASDFEDALWDYQHSDEPVYRDDTTCMVSVKNTDAVPIAY